MTRVCRVLCRRGDVYLLFKLLLCKNDKRVYGIRDKQLVKIVSRYLSCPADDMISDLELGDLAGTCKKVRHALIELELQH